MSINKENIIHCLNHSQLSGCLDCPHYKELNGSLLECRRQRISEAVSIIEDYKKIEQIYSDYLKYMNPDNFADRMGEVLEDGNDGNI